MLPLTIQCYIMSFLPPKDWIQMSSCSHEWKSVSENKMSSPSLRDFRSNLRDLFQFRPSKLVFHVTADLAEFGDMSSVKHITAFLTKGIDRLTNLESMTILGDFVSTNLRSLTKLTKLSYYDPNHLSQVIPLLPTSITELHYFGHHPVAHLLGDIKIQKLKVTNIPSDIMQYTELTELQMAKYDGAKLPPSLRSLRICGYKNCKNIDFSRIQILDIQVIWPGTDYLHLIGHIPNIKIRLIANDFKIPFPEALLSKVVTANIRCEAPVHKMPSLEYLNFESTHGDDIIINCEMSQFQFWPKLSSIYCDMIKYALQIMKLLHDAKKPANTYPRCQLQSDKPYTLIMSTPTYESFYAQIPKELHETFGICVHDMDSE